MSWTIPLLEAIGLFDPEFCQMVLPANQASIEALAVCLRRPLPRVYIEFLQCMGTYDGGLFWPQRVIPDVAEVIAYVRRYQDEQEGEPSVVPFAVGIDFDGFGLQLTAEGEEHPVVILHHLDAGEEVCRSLPMLAWSHAFLFEAAAAGRVVVVRSLEKLFAIDPLHAVLVDNGYQPRWFSRPTKRFMRKGRALLTLYSSPSGILQIQLGSPDETVTNDALVELRRLIGSFKYEWVDSTTLPQARLGRRDIEEYQVC